jgi:hypothetical protein
MRERDWREIGAGEGEVEYVCFTIGAGMGGRGGVLAAHAHLHVVAGAAAGDDIVPAACAAFALGDHVVEGHFRREAFGAAISAQHAPRRAGRER